LKEEGVVGNEGGENKNINHAVFLVTA